MSSGTYTPKPAGVGAGAGAPRTGGGDRGGDRGAGRDRGGDDRDEERGGGRRFGRRRVCRFCADTTIPIDFKDTNTLKYFTSERGKIIPRRISGNCQKHQKHVSKAIKQARNVALLPYASSKI